jgi:hypothetical protein
MSAEFWLLLGIDALAAIAVFVGRNGLKAWIEKGVQHRFDTRLEELRTEFRKSEELLKSELRDKESEIAALRDGVLSGRTQRQALIDKRRLEAIDKLWAGISALAPFKAVSASMVIVNVENVAKAAPNDPKIRQFMSMITAPHADKFASYDNPAKNEQPFVAPLAWAYFQAYQVIVTSAFAYAKVLELGIEKPSELIASENIKKVVKAALPYYAEYIDQHDITVLHYLLDDLEKQLVAEIQRMLAGEEQDQAGVEQAARIMEQVREATKNTALSAVSVAAPTGA